MDAGIILSGRSPNIMGEYARGLGTAQMQTDMRRKNALADLYAQQGPQIMAGNPQALNALAAYDPAIAMDIQGAQLNQQATRQGMAFDAEQMQMQREEAKRQAEALLMEQQDKLSAAQAAEHQRTMMGILGGGAQAHQQGPQAFAGWLAQSGLQGLSYEQFPIWAAQTAGEIDALDAWAKMQPKPVEPKVGAIPEGSYMVDPNDPSKGLAPIPGYSSPQVYRAATPEEAAQYGAATGQINTKTGQFTPINPPSGTSLQTNPDGSVTFSQGPGVKPLTEAQGKDNVFATRAEGALADLEPIADALASYPQQVMGADPTGMVRQYQSPEYQTAKNAADEFLTAILRKDTGAAITPQEQAIYGDTYLPRPGDGPAVLKQKAKARARALEALKSGMDQRQIAMTEKALVDAAARTGQAAPEQGAQTGTVLRFDAQGNLLP